MADFSKFRTSLNGFNRADVTNYIETLCAEHRRTLAQAQADSEDLRKQLEASQSALDLQIEKSQTLEAKLEETETALQSTEAALDEAMSMLVEPAEEAPAEETPDYSSMELEAYRRAEALERATTERAAKIRRHLDDLIEETAGRYEQVGQDIKSLSDDLGMNLQRLQEALSELDSVFEETTDRFDRMDTNETEE